MKTIGVLFGMENSFPGALVEHINARNIEGIRAEFVQTGAVHLDKVPRYSVIVDRISHDIPFYRAFLKHAAINGTVIINNPFWWSADDKFFNYTLAERLGVAVPATVILPHKQLPAETTERSMRNLEYPLDWDAVFAYVGEHGFLKPVDGGGWRDVYHVHNREEFFRAYDQSRDLCMMYQTAVDFKEYFRCYVVGQKKVRIMPYDPRRPHAERYIQDPPRYSRTLLRRVEQDALKLCRALGYDLNTVEFAVENGIPYAIDFMNPAPDADLNSVGAANFEWIVREVADIAIAKAKTAPHVPELRWSAFLGGNVAKAKAARKKRASKRAVSGKAARAVGTVTKKNSKLAEDEEAMAAAAEPMGSVAAAVPRDQGSSAAQMKKPKPPKPAVEDAEAKPTRP
jgi:glutathione synthase/RimK-type ligase-like ATP-grasp enzyme